MPPMVQWLPGSTGKNKPWSRRKSLSCCRVTPGSIRQSMSSGLTSWILVMRARSRLMPCRTGLTCPSRLVPAPNAVTGTPCWWQSTSRRLTSSVVSAKTTASGRVGGVWSSPRACCSRTASAVDSRSPRNSRAAAMTASTGRGEIVFMASRHPACGGLGPSLADVCRRGERREGNRGPAGRRHLAAARRRLERRGSAGNGSDGGRPLWGGSDQGILTCAIQPLRSIIPSLRMSKWAAEAAGLRDGFGEG